MKSQLKFFLSAAVLITLMSSFVKLAVMPKNEVVTIQTSAICERCQARIENALKNTDGVLEAKLNLNNKKVKVKYDGSKTSVDAIRAAISNTGYDADNVKANVEAFHNLPHCCKKGSGECEKEKH